MLAWPMLEFDRGPNEAIAKILAEVPDPPRKENFWFDWGPIFYRGRLDGSARVICIASDPGPTERIAGRTLVGDAGQLVQGFLTKLGLARSYVCLNAWPYALVPDFSDDERPRLADPVHRNWRNRLYDAVVGDDLHAVIAFGVNAKAAVSLWGDCPKEPIEIPHPSNPTENVTVAMWRKAIERLRAEVSPEAGGSNKGSNYEGSSFKESDYAPIPRRDLPFGAAAFLGDDAWVRAQPGLARNSVGRPDKHTLSWKAPKA
jgi:hypothetical protein